MPCKKTKTSDLTDVPQADSAVALVLQRVAAFPSLPDEALIDPRTVAGLFACSVETIKRRVRAKQFPPPVALTTNTIRWPAGVVRAELARLTQQVSK
jgi:predicted DNA-binding transcriptional regulator AlpA